MFNSVVFADDPEIEKIQGMVNIPTGSYEPLFKTEDGLNKISVDSFYLDKYQVSNAEFTLFTKKNKKWAKENNKPIFNDINYLKHLDTDLSAENAEQPVVNVSWFAARAYCKAQGKRLPTTAEWEYVGSASKTKANGKSETGYQQRILDWYAKPARAILPRVSEGEANFWKVHGMHGVVWELVNDFNTSLVSGESRGDSTLENSLFCGAGAASSADPGDYAAFMRYALRSSYEANYTMESLGFRCAKDFED